ncbi:MAG: PDDEXK nuclease domain-containing protein [Bacteroidales bacterium]|nr:PDDEXK nuclease domain-containing protein [Bacteroidales bacterium]
MKVYHNLLNEIKKRVRIGQLRASLSANTEMLAAYWDIGKMIHERQQQEGWGKGVIPRLASDLKNELSDVKGFSERNLRNMVNFYLEYSDASLIWQLPVAKLKTNEQENQKLHVSKLVEVKNSIGQLPVAQLQNTDTQNNLILLTGWAHHIILIQKVKDRTTRLWYMQQIITNGWSRDTLSDMIKNELHKRQGHTVTNFELTLPPLQSVLAKQMLKDPYIFDFTTLATEYTERELELELVKNVEKFILELGAGFAFVGRQYKLVVSDQDFYIDLLFYHLKMRCFVVIELKKGDFIPEYAGKMNFYCSAVDDILKHATDQNTIGLILCQGKDKLFAEYALKDINKPIGISDYELTRALPDKFKGSLPSIEEIEEELNKKFSK